MMDIESHTIIYLRDPLSTRVVRDNEVTAFRSCWACELVGGAGFEPATPGL
jgi:hypothetical protein